MPPSTASFPVPFAAPERQSWRAIASSLGSNALAGFPANTFDELAVVRSFAGRQQIILSDPAGIRHILIENADNYRRTAATARLLGPVVGDGMLLSDGEDWRTQRRAAAPAFAPRMMPAVAAHAARAAERLVDALAAQAGAEVDLFARLQILALEVAAAALFSFDITPHADELRTELQSYANGIGRPGLLDFLLPRRLPAPGTLARRRFRRRWMALPVPARGVVLIVPWVLHRHRMLWRDPDRFEPERFLPDAEPPARFSYLPFGAGPRACIGAQFALTETVLVLARLVQSFRLELADDAPVQPMARITLQPDRSPPFHLTPR